MADDFASDDLFAVFDDDNSHANNANIATNDQPNSLTHIKNQSGKRKRKSSDRHRDDKHTTSNDSSKDGEKRQKSSTTHISFEKMYVFFRYIDQIES